MLLIFYDLKTIKVYGTLIVNNCMQINQQEKFYFFDEKLLFNSCILRQANAVCDIFNKKLLT